MSRSPRDLSQTLALSLLTTSCIGLLLPGCEPEEPLQLDLSGAPDLQQGLGVEGDSCTTSADCTSNVCVLGYCQPAAAPLWTTVNPAPLGAFGSEKAVPNDFRNDTAYCAAFTLQDRLRVRAYAKKAGTSSNILDGAAEAGIVIMKEAEPFYGRRLAYANSPAPGSGAYIDVVLPAENYLMCLEWIHPPTNPAIPHALKILTSNDGSPPSNDSCMTASSLPVSPFLKYPRGYHNNHHPMPRAPCGKLEAKGIDFVYKIDLDAGEELTATVLANSGKDGVLYLLDQCPRTYDSCVAAVDDVDGSGAETIVFENTTGSTQTYYLVIDSKGPRMAPFNVTWSIQ